MNQQDIDLIEEHCIRESRKSFYSYRQYISDFKLKTGWFVKEISSIIQQFYDDYKAGKRPVYVICTPPQHGKSAAVTDGISWMAGDDPSIRFIYSSFSERLGVRANLSTQRTLSREKYGKIFPETNINRKNTVTSMGYQRNREMIEFCESGGSFRNTTVRGSITGETLDIGIIDDAIKGREEANSQTVRDNTWSWFTDDFMSRFDELAGMLFITTRWHKDDPAGRLIKSDPNVKVFEFKAIAEKDEENRKEGEALFPEHKSLEFLLSRKKIMPAGNWQALFQQSPVIVGGNKFKSEWWKYYTMLPKIRTRIIYGDTAQKKEQQHDYTVFQCWGISYDDQLYLIDQYRGKIESPELLVNARAFWNKHKAVTGLGTLSAFKVEDKVSGTGLIQTLKREGGVPIIGIPRSTDKILRSEDVLPMIESGNVFLPRDAPWLSDYLSEFEQFPNGTNDDQVDPTIDAISDQLGVHVVDYSKLI
mgnify:CR=1 FL=1